MNEQLRNPFPAQVRRARFSEEFAPVEFSCGFDWEEIYHHDPIAPRRRPDNDRRVQGTRYRIAPVTQTTRR